MVEIRIADSCISDKWDDYVNDHPAGCVYHLFGWKNIIEKSMGLKSHYVYASENGKICGIVPLFLSSSVLFGRYLTSIPFFNYGGILADNDLVAGILFGHCGIIARSEKASYVELRHISKLIDNVPVKSHKARMVLALDDDPNKMWEGFKSKLRSQIKRPMRENMNVVFGAKELVADFYSVFSNNMRDLGTPVWSINLFTEILEWFGDHTQICMVYHKGLPVASGFLVFYKDSAEIWTASSLRKYNNLSPNMLLYWRAIEYACKKGCKKFDFGRSSLNSGTYRFKEQWGALPEVLNWQYWLPQGAKLPEINPSNPKYKLFIMMWRRLPVFAANLIGPSIARNLP